MTALHDTRSRLVTGADFRAALGRFASGVTVITVQAGGQDWGATVSAFSSVSDDPPTVLVCLNTASDTGHAVQAAGSFVVNVLSRGQDALAMRFARKGGGKFDGLDVLRSADGHPVLTDAHVSLECRIATQLRFGTHDVLIAQVEATSLGLGTAPLAYHEGRFGRLTALPRSGGTTLIGLDPAHEHDLW